MNTRALAVAALLVLTGCGGGGGSSAPQVPVPLPTATVTAPHEVGKATLTLTTPPAGAPAAGARAPRYVSPNSAAVQVTINSIDGNTTLPAGVPRTTTVALSSAPGGNCTTSPAGETCTVTIPAPAGQVSYTFTLLDGASPPNQLATLTQTYTIAPGTSPNLQAQLDGIVAGVQIIAPTFHAGTAFSGPLTVNAFDASGAKITGPAPFSKPFTLTDGDTSGHTSLTANGQTGLTVQVNGPNDVVTINYDGQPNDSFTISSGGGSLPPGGGGSTSVPSTNGSSPTPSPTPSPVPTAAPTGSASPVPTATPTAGPTPTPTDTPTAGPTATPTAGPTATPTAGPTATPTPAPTATPTPAPTATPTAGPTPTPTPSPSPTPAPGSIVLSGTVADTAATGGSPSDPNWMQQTLYFVAAGQTRQFTVSQTGAVGFTIDLDHASCRTAPPSPPPDPVVMDPALASPAGSSETFSVTALNPGICKATVNGAGGATAVLYFSATQGQFSVQSRKRR